MSDTCEVLCLPDRRLSVVSDCVESGSFDLLQDCVLRVLAANRARLAARRSRTAISYADLRNCCPLVTRFYESDLLRQAVSEMAGVSLVPTHSNDENSCSILVYQKPGDHIGWHYDRNFYRGRRFTGLLSLVNEHLGEPRQSSAAFRVKFGSVGFSIPMPPNTLVLLEGAAVRHCVTPLRDKERRIVLSMSFCSDSTTTRFNALHLGLRALWA